MHWGTNHILTCGTTHIGGVSVYRYVRAMKPVSVYRCSVRKALSGPGCQTLWNRYASQLLNNIFLDSDILEVWVVHLHEWKSSWWNPLQRDDENWMKNLQDEREKPQFPWFTTMLRHRGQLGKKYHGDIAADSIFRVAPDPPDTSGRELGSDIEVKWLVLPPKKGYHVSWIGVPGVNLRKPPSNMSSWEIQKIEVRLGKASNSTVEISTDTFDYWRVDNPSLRRTNAGINTPHSSFKPHRWEIFV